MRLIFGWHISLKRLYFKSSRVEYRVRLWRKMNYHRPPKAKLAGDCNASSAPVLVLLKQMRDTSNPLAWNLGIPIDSALPYREEEIK